jgi:hypothetical protein
MEINSLAYREIMECAIQQGFVKPMLFGKQKYVTLGDYFSIRHIEW